MSKPKKKVLIKRIVNLDKGIKVGTFKEITTTKGMGIEIGVGNEI